MTNQQQSRTGGAALLALLAAAAVGCATNAGTDGESHFQRGHDAGTRTDAALRAVDAEPGTNDTRHPSQASAPDASDAGRRWLDPTVLATDPEGPYALVVDASYVYWVNAGMIDQHAAVRRVPRGGGRVDTLDERQGFIAYTLAADSSQLYVAYIAGPGGKGNVVAIPKDPGRPPYDLASADNTTFITVANGWLYYNLGLGPKGKIARVPTKGGATETVVAKADFPWSFGSDGTNLFYSEMYKARILRVPVTGGTSTPLATGSNWVATREVYVEGTDVVFAVCVESSCNPTNLYRVPKTGGPSVELRSVASPHGDLAVVPDGFLLGNLLLSADGTNETTLATPVPSAVVLVGGGDDRSLFFGDYGTGSIYRIDRAAR